ncbi:MAG: prepilin-type N-terminal cleavage/methylation domain-containing protein [bacterium]|nr:prepilin-type N-terminal cleavage/methylation domain-containing protein [bacterium]
MFHTHKQNIQNSRSGFTLIEMMVATFIFVVVVVALLDLFSLAQRAQRTAASMENLQDNLRFSINRITDDVRDGGIDYAYYQAHPADIDPDSGAANILAVRSFDGTSLWFKKGDGTAGDCVDTETNPETKNCLLISDDDSTWHSLTGDGVSVEYLKFYILPTVDPFEIDTDTGMYNAHQQPRVRIVVKGTGRVRQTDVKIPMFLQTLITTREYRR